MAKFHKLKTNAIVTFGNPCCEGSLSLKRFGLDHRPIASDFPILPRSFTINGRMTMTSEGKIALKEWEAALWGTEEQACIEGRKEFVRKNIDAG